MSKIPEVPAILHVDRKLRAVHFVNGAVIRLAGHPRSIPQLSLAAFDIYERHLNAGFTEDEMCHIFTPAVSGGVR